MAVSNIKKSEIKYHSNVEEYLPYACHFDEETILTKNGELIQVIKITGFNFETVKEIEKDNSNLRDLIRKTIKKNITKDEFAVWIHTLRRKRDISIEQGHEEGFSKQLNHEWVVRNNWKHQFLKKK